MNISSNKIYSPNIDINNIQPNLYLVKNNTNSQQNLGQNSVNQVYKNLTQDPNNYQGNQSQLNRSSLNTHLATQAYNILNSNLGSEQKAIALAEIGLSTEVASNVLGKSNANKGNVLLNVAQIANNWSDLSDEDRVASVAQLIASSSGTSVSGAIAGVITGGYQVIQGIEQADNIIDVVKELPRSQALKPGAIGLSVAGLNIGLGAAGVAAGVSAIAAGSLSAGFGTFLAAGSALGPIGLGVGLVAGLVSAFTGSGKSTSQVMRDGWRDGLEQQGLAQVIDGSHHVPLADGSLYNIGIDGSNKIPNVGQNVDGKTERYTFDVDFSNEVAVASIPEGHLFAIASGLDPTSAKDHRLFERAMAQGLNAATSNATSVEEVRANFRAMLGETTPEQIGLRLEVLRATNKITGQEYGVYLHHLNKIYGTNLAPSDANQARQFLATQIAQKPQEEWSAAEQNLFLQLTDQETITEAQSELEQRLLESQRA